MNLIYVIDTRTRFCELGAWCPTQTESGDIILRRAVSFGSLWDLYNGKKILFEEGLLGVLGEGYEAMSSAGFVGTQGTPWRSKNVAAIIESGGKTKIRAERLRLFPEGSTLYIPKKQPVQMNRAVTEAAIRALQALGRGFLVSEGQSNTLQYAQILWSNTEPPENELNFTPEHKESLAALYVEKNEDGRLWTFRPPALSLERVMSPEEIIARGIVLGEIVPSNFPDITIQDAETGENYSQFAEGLYTVQSFGEKGVWLRKEGEFWATDLEWSDLGDLTQAQR